MFPGLAPSCPDAAWFRKLKQAYYQIAVANIRKLQALDEIEAALAAARIPVLAIKGVAMLDHFYPDAGARFMEDMDMMVDPSRREAFDALLIRAGYQRHRAFKHIYHKDDITIDVHTHPLNIGRIASRDFLPSAQLSSIWTEARPLKPGFLYLRRPADTDMFILALHHLIKHSLSRLIWLLDLKQMVACQSASFWQQLEEKATAYQQKRIIAYGLYLLRNHLHWHPPPPHPPHPPDTVGFETGLPRLSRIETNILDLWGRTRQTGDTGHLLWLLCLPTVRQRAAFLIESAFPKKTILRQEQPLSSTTSSVKELYWFRSRQVVDRLLKNLVILHKGFLRK